MRKQVPRQPRHGAVKLRRPQDYLVGDAKTIPRPHPVVRLHQHSLPLLGDGRLRQEPTPPGGGDGWLRQVQARVNCPAAV